MAKITRQQQKIFAGNSNNQVTAFGTAKDAQPVYATSAGEVQTTSFSQGWIPALTNDLAPFLEDSNGLWYMITSQVAYLLQEGIPEYDTNTEYFKGSLVKYTNSDGDVTIYKSTVDGNKGVNPTNANNNNWAIYLQDNNLAKYEIALPQPSLTGKLLKNEVYLEGQIVSRTQYTNLFNAYGTTYGAGDGVSTFQLPDMRNKVLWGIDNNNFGYLPESLPNITGSIKFSGIDPATNKGSATGAFTKSNSSGAGNGHDYPKGSSTVTFDFNANRVNPIYQDGANVRPNAIKVRWKTRWY